MTRSESARLAGSSKSARKIKSSCRNLRKGMLIFQKKYPGKTIHDFYPANPNRITAKP